MHSWTTMTTCRMLHLLSLGMATAAAFTAPTTIHRSWTATTPIVRSVVAVPKSSPPTLAFASSKKDESTAATCSTTMNDIIIINGQNIALTPALVDYVNKRIGKTLSKLFTSGAIRECDVILSVSKNPKVRKKEIKIALHYFNVHPCVFLFLSLYCAVPHYNLCYYYYQLS